MILNKKISGANIPAYVIILLSVAACGLELGGCSKKAAPEEVEAARQVVEKYNTAWLSRDVDTMFRLSTRERILNMTEIDPDEGSANLELAKKRFGLLAEQTRLFLGYERLEIEGVVGSEPGRVVFQIKAWHKKGSRVAESDFIREVVKTKDGWQLN